MPSLDDLKKRIKSVKSTQKITKAMKMVAAANLEKLKKCGKRKTLQSKNAKYYFKSY